MSDKFVNTFKKIIQRQKVEFDKNTYNLHGEFINGETFDIDFSPLKVTDEGYFNKGNTVETENFS